MFTSYFFFFFFSLTEEKEASPNQGNMNKHITSLNRKRNNKVVLESSVSPFCAHYRPSCPVLISLPARSPVTNFITRKRRSNGS